MQILQNCVVFINDFDLPLKSSKILFYFQNLKIHFLLLVFLFIFFDKVKNSNGGVLLFINTSNNLAMMNVLISRDFWKGSFEGFIFNFNFTTLNCKMMNLEGTSEKKHFFLA